MPIAPVDLTLAHYQRAKDVQLVLVDGCIKREAVQHVDTYEFTFASGQTIAKTDCIGAFPLALEALLQRTTHPVYTIAPQPSQRVNAAKIRRLRFPRHLGCLLQVVLVNGWELTGTVVALNLYHLVLETTNRKRLALFRHAIVDYTILKSAAEHPAGQALLCRQQQQNRAQTAKPAAATPVRHASTDPTVLWQALAQERPRTMVNAKLKIVLRQIPPTLQELEGLVWIPLENNARAVPAGLELPTTLVDLLIPSKMWHKAVTRAAALQAETGQAPIHIVEALIGIKDNRLAAVASGVQVVPGKAAT